MKKIICFILLLCSSLSNAEPVLIHLSEETSMSQAQEFLTTLDNKTIQENVKLNYPNLNSYLAQIKTDFLTFTSGITNKTRPVIRMNFEYSAAWARAEEFQHFITEQIKSQLPVGYEY